MEKIAILVDAGYLLSACYTLESGSSRPVRKEIVLDGEELLPVLLQKAQEVEPARELLRVYWYDAPLSSGRLTDEQNRLRKLDHFKLRLGTLNSRGEQKGVDTLIVLDLIALSEHRAVDSILLASGDEDLLAAVEIAQQHGVRVHLIGVDDEKHPNQSPRLVEECDTSSRFKPEDISKFFAILAQPVDDMVSAEPSISGAGSDSSVGQMITATVRNWGYGGRIYFTYAGGSKKAMLFEDQLPSEVLNKKGSMLAEGMTVAVKIKSFNSEGAIVTMIF